jgi:hypothetical protein
MTLEQFKLLAQAYGADLSQWPKEYQSEASSLSNMFINEVRDILNKEANLDKLLTSHTIAPASRALFDSIVASAPQPKIEFWQPLSNWMNYCQGHIWQVVGATLASAMAGALCVSLLISSVSPINGESNNLMVEHEDSGNDWITL